jgi:putative transposase
LGVDAGPGIVLAMATTPRPNDPFSEKALLRYHVVSLVRARLLRGESLARAVEEVASMRHPTVSGEPRRVSARTVYRWVAAYERGGTDALADKRRSSERASRVLSPRLLRYLTGERGRDRDASIPELLERAEQEGLLESWRDVDRTTVYRALVRMGVPTTRRKSQRGRDQRRFDYAHRMELVLCDGVHFRAGGTSKRRVACFFLCGATRFGLHVVVGPSESAALFLRGFHEVLLRYGRLGILYLDHGPGFIASAVAEVCRRLEIALVHGRANYPEGHGKIEKFNQTARKKILRGLARPDVDPAYDALELRLSHWLRERYNHHPHESLVRPRP